MAFLGPDGSGKSTLTDLLVRRLQGHGEVLAVHRVYMGSGTPLLPTRRLMRRLRRKTGRNPKPPPTLRGIAPRRLRGPCPSWPTRFCATGSRRGRVWRPTGSSWSTVTRTTSCGVNNQTIQRAWFRRLAVRVIPRPHLTILLEGDPVAVAARKRELTVEETIRQQAAYRALEQLVPDFLPIDLTDRDDRAIDLVAMKVLGAYARRNRGLVPW